VRLFDELDDVGRGEGVPMEPILVVLGDFLTHCCCCCWAPVFLVGLVAPAGATLAESVDAADTVRLCALEAVLSSSEVPAGAAAAVSAAAAEVDDDAGTDDLVPVAGLAAAPLAAGLPALQTPGN